MKRDDIKNWIVKNIRSGDFAYGSAIPTRHTIMRRFNVARSTVDKVIKELISEGYLRGVRGGGTYASSPPEERMPLLYIISDWTTGHSEHHNLIVDHLDEIEGVLNYKIYDTRRMRKDLDILLQQATCIIWDRPKIIDHPIFQAFDEAGIPQLTVNRVFGDHDSIMTDIAEGIKEAMNYLRNQSSKESSFHVMAPQPDHFLPFLTKRELAFYEECVNSRIPISRVERYPSRIIVSGRIEACRKSFSSFQNGDLFFLPYSRDLPHLLSVAREKGLSPGKDFSVLTWDEATEFSDIPGLVFLENPWDEMYEAALKWALSDKSSKYNIMLKPKMRVTPTTGGGDDAR